MASINYLDYQIFDLVTIEDFFNMCQIPQKELVGYKSKNDFVKDFKDKSNIHRISIGKADKAYCICRQMVEVFFEKTSISPKDIDSIILVDPFSTTTSFGSIPHCIAKEFNCEHANIFILNQACGSSFLCMSLADNFLKKEDSFMLVLSTCFAPNIDHRLSHTSIIGDAIGMLVMQKNNEGDILIRNSKTISDGTNSYNKYYNVHDELDAITIARIGTQTIKGLLEKENQPINSISKIIPQNINAFAYTNLYSKFLKVPPSIFYLDNISEGGHLGDVDIIRNLKDYSRLIEENQYNKENILLYGMGGPEGKDKNFHAILVDYK